VNLTLGTRWGEWLGLRNLLLYAVDKRLCGPHRRHGRYGGKKNAAATGIESRRSARSLVTHITGFSAEEQHVMCAFYPSLLACRVFQRRSCCHLSAV
jgi:hypothetical protein